MTNFKELILHSIIKPQDTIRKLCRPIQDNLAIDHFAYIRIYRDGRYSQIANCPDIVEFFYENDLHISHPHVRNPTLFEAGFALMPVTKEDCYQEKSIQLYRIDQTVLILKKSEEYAEHFLFAPKKLAKQDCSFLFHQLHLLDKFAHYFRREAITLINRSLDVGVNIRNELKEQFDITDPNIPLFRKDLKKQAFLKTILPLTSREQACLNLFKTGHSAQTTGAKLKISQRTVEHHFENIKEKLGCRSKWDLLDM